MAQQNVKPNGYRPRIVDKQIERYMRIFGAVEIAGTKWCGKTWAARAHANSITYVDRDNNLPMVFFDLGCAGNIVRVVEGEKIGTTVHA